jgi:pimeloyl-ACP methyl ester carboxylesterase
MAASDARGIGEPWEIEGAAGQVILGDCHRPPRPRGVMAIAHGFKGYKDYGMFPVLAAAAAGAGWIAHRFNFSHSGMTRSVATFQRPDLFERDTWNRQVEDLEAIVTAIGSGVLAGRGMPLVLVGHSRGGASVLLASGRRAGARAFAPARLVTVAAPDTCNPLGELDRVELLRTGSLPSPSSRTGQVLRIGRAFLQEQLDDPAGHDLLRLAGRVACPVLVAHGTADTTVPPPAALTLAAAARCARLCLIEGADHVFNTPNPATADPSPQLKRLIDAMLDFAASA